MTRFHLGFVLLALYIGWVMYRALIKKDIKQHKNEVSLYTFIVVVWLAIYYWFFAKEINQFISAL